MALPKVKGKRRPVGPALPRPRKLADLQAMADERGLLRGKTHVLRGRMPETLIQAAKENSGVESDTELLKLGLATLALQDHYADWLLKRRGKLPPDLNFEV